VSETLTWHGKHEPVEEFPPMAQPARHRERAGKLYPPAIQTSVSEQKPENSSLRRSRKWSHCIS
jgi:hypothetical protein